jgi:hypothetical protein
LFAERFGFINAMYFCALIRFIAGAAILQYG